MDLQQIINIRAALNKGLSEKLLNLFPKTCAVARPVTTLQAIPDSQWMVGFCDGELNFSVNIINSFTCKLSKQIRLEFSVGQHIRDQLLLTSFINYFNCGLLVKYENSITYKVVKFNDIHNIIITIFKDYLLQSTKLFNFLDFCKVSSMIENKEHLTKKGLEEIIKIKAGMNMGRKY